MLSPVARRALVALAAALVVALTVRLGVWQLDRAQQKTALQEAIDTRSRMPALDAAALARDSAQLAGQEHRRVQLRGRWLADRTVYLDNRQMGGRPGFYMLTPLQLADGSAVLVQRGWLARDAADRTRIPHVETPPGEVSVSGRIARGPARLYEFEASQGGPIRQNVDVADFSRETGLALRPLAVLQTDAQPDGLLREWPRPAVDVNKNLGYAGQWFALGALVAGLYVWFQLVVPWRRRRR